MNFHPFSRNSYTTKGIYSKGMQLLIKLKNHPYKKTSGITPTSSFINPYHTMC